MSLRRSVLCTASAATPQGPLVITIPFGSPARIAALHTSTGVRQQSSTQTEADSSSTSYGNHEGHAPEKRNEVSKPTDSDLSATHKRKTQAELDEQLRQKMAATMGDGGEAGVELEGGKEKGMGRAVKDNMFRYI